MGSLSKQKGKRNEQQVAKYLREALPTIAEKIHRRGWQQVDDPDLPDIDLGGIFHVEAKCGARPNVARALRQAQSHCPPHKYAVAYCRWDGQNVGDGTITMTLNTWRAWLTEWLRETSP